MQPIRALALAVGSHGPSPDGWRVPVRALGAIDRTAGDPALDVEAVRILGTTGEDHAIAAWRERVHSHALHYPELLAAAVAARRTLTAASRLALGVLAAAAASDDPRTPPGVRATLDEAIGEAPVANEWPRRAIRIAEGDANTPARWQARRATRPVESRQRSGHAFDATEKTGRGLAASTAPGTAELGHQRWPPKAPSSRSRSKTPPTSPWSCP